jgi:hypothetical protein
MKLFKIVLFLILFSCSVTYAANQPVKDDYEWPMYAFINGIVLDSANKLPLKNVTIKAKNPFASQLNYFSAVTDESGSYTVLIKGKTYGLEPNEKNFKAFPKKNRDERYTLSFEKKGYLQSQKIANVTLKLFLLPEGLENKLEKEKWEEENIVKNHPKEIPNHTIDTIYLKEGK